MNSMWPRVRLGEVLTHRKEFVTVDDLQVYKRLRVRLHAQGIILRDEVLGAEIKTKTQQVCREGDFLVAEIDAKVGGYGIVPAGLSGAIVSSHYFLFVIDAARLDPSFLGWFIKTPAFRRQVEAQGSTNYAAIRPGHVLSYEIPLPPITEQRRIVTRILDLIREVSDAERLRVLSIAETKALVNSARRAFFGDDVQPDWRPLCDVIVDIENGWSPQCYAYPATGDAWGVIKVGSVSFGEFNETENKELPSVLSPRPEYEVNPGDFLFSRANTVELVGACALVRSTRPRLMLSDKIFRFRFHPDGSIDPAYLNHALKSPVLRKQIERGATGTSPTMKNISKAKILELRIPVPTLEVQRRVTTNLDATGSQAVRLGDLQAQTKTALCALQASILDRAFKGDW